MSRTTKLIALAVVIQAPSCGLVHAGEWRTSYVVEESTLQFLHGLDTLQTLQIAKHSERWQETQAAWCIGHAPTKGAVIAYMAGESVAHLAITALMVRYDAPAWSIHAWEGLSIAVQAGTLKANYNIGIHF